ncbi:protein E7B [Elephant endotheliotropic herpesvirus 3A]|uniref:Protein E7B n=1 Tax=Elephant endotheliotropic herpesvirus 3A TaxID=1329409 RepID=A0A866VSU9_9BETA|nr:protein E7B [Elephant endotheliotropic herpesvirus 3A]QOE74370.1 protein E7B [Elephant endotheliotropic herpesvirus 3A]
MKRRNLTNHYLKLIRLQSYQHSLVDIFLLCIIIYFLLITILSCFIYNINKKKQNRIHIGVFITIMLLYNTYRLLLQQNRDVCKTLYIEPLNYYYFNMIIYIILYIHMVICFIKHNFKTIIYKFLIYTFFFKHCTYFTYFDVCDRLKRLHDPYSNTPGDLVHKTNFVSVFHNTDFVDTYILFILLISVFVVIGELLDNVIIFIPNPIAVLFMSSFVLIYFINENIFVWNSMFYSRMDLYLLGIYIYTFTKSLLEISQYKINIWDCLLKIYFYLRHMIPPFRI